MTDTINNVPCELLETLIEQHITAHGFTNHTARQAQLILCAPSPAGVDGLNTDRNAAFKACPESGCDWGSFYLGWKARGEVEQAIIDGLRGEVERLQMKLAACGVVALANTIEIAGKARQMHPDYMSASCSDVAGAVDREIALRTERDQQAQRIGELEGLLRDERAYGTLGVSCQNGVVARCVCRMCRLRHIDAALSSGKDSAP